MFNVHKLVHSKLQQQIIKFFAVNIGVLSIAGTFPAPASAAGYTITLSGITYDVTLLPFGTFDDNAAQLTDPGNLLLSNPSLAESLAGAPETISLGGINTDVFGAGTSFGPLFSTGRDSIDPSTNNGFTYAFVFPLPGVPKVIPYGTQNGTFNGIRYNYTYATAAVAPTPSSVPAPLPLLGVSAAFGYSRKLRKRIRQN